MAIVVPEICYINFQLQFDDKGVLIPDKLPLGFATYFENNPAFDKRKKTIDYWSRLETTWYERNDGGYILRDDDDQQIQHTVVGVRPMETFDNPLRTGFCISREVKRYGWNGGNVVWRVEDPLGFELEISSQNMAQIMMHCDINKGNINTPCRWGWDKTGGSRLVLLPENSEPLEIALKETELHNKTVATKDVELMDSIQLKNGAVGIYYGVVSTLMREYGTDGKGEQFVDRRRYIVKLPDNTFYAVSRLNTSKILGKAGVLRQSMSQDEAIAEINTSIKNGNVITDQPEQMSWNERYSNAKICVVGKNKKALVDRRLVLIQVDGEFDKENSSQVYRVDTSYCFAEPHQYGEKRRDEMFVSIIDEPLLQTGRLYAPRGSWRNETKQKISSLTNVYNVGVMLNDIIYPINLDY